MLRSKKATRSASASAEATATSRLTTRQRHIVRIMSSRKGVGWTYFDEAALIVELMLTMPKPS